MPRQNGAVGASEQSAVLQSLDGAERELVDLGEATGDERAQQMPESTKAKGPR